MSGPRYTLYQHLPGMVLGFHGCDAQVGERVLSGDEPHLHHSDNKYDWLGKGIYFWENDPQRAMEFALEGTTKPTNSKGYIETPFVLGAVIDLGFCLNLLAREACEEAKAGYETLAGAVAASSESMPQNKGRNMGARFLDRAVIETVHETRVLFNELLPGQYQPYDSVRAAFLEGGGLYNGSGFEAKNHIQLAIRNSSCIKGYFRPISA